MKKLRLLRQEYIRRLIRCTFNSKLVGIYRIALGTIFAALGFMKLFSENIRKKWWIHLDEIGLPFEYLNHILVPSLEIVIGVILLLGFYSRIAAFLVIPIMTLPIYIHLTILCPNIYISESFEVFLPSLSVMMALVILTYGGGKWSLDLKFFPEKF